MRRVHAGAVRGTATLAKTGALPRADRPGPREDDLARVALRGGAVPPALRGADAREVVCRVGGQSECCWIEPRAAGERQQGVQKVAHRVGVRALLELVLEGVRERGEGPPLGVVHARDSAVGLPAEAEAWAVERRPATAHGSPRACLGPRAVSACALTSTARCRSTRNWPGSIFRCLHVRKIEVRTACVPAPGGGRFPPLV